MSEMDTMDIMLYSQRRCLEYMHFIYPYWHIQVTLLIANGANKADVYAEGSTVQSSGNQMIVIQLNKGDDVAVQSKNQADYIDSNNNIHTTFSGFLARSDLNGDIIG